MSKTDLSSPLLSAVDYYKSEKDQQNDRTEEINALAKQRLQTLKGEVEFGTEDTLKILNSFYDNWRCLDSENLSEDEEVEIELAFEKPSRNVAKNEQQMFAESSNSSFVEEFKEQVTPLMTFNAKFAGRPLSQIFKYATELAAKSGNPPSEEISKLAAKYPEAVIETFDFSPQELADYKRISKLAIEMLGRDLSILFNAPPEQPKAPKRHVSILKRRSNSQSRNSPLNTNQPAKRVRISEPMQESQKSTNSVFRFDSNSNERWLEKLNQEGLAKIIPELKDDKLLIPYPPSAFFAFPMP
ncbi:hypothetical protein M3Y97_00507500 [Aphelenchoides bicaudatus]|nr:hypothetical protein M3Y97_00507500 [Aphelenchoides bicaudatus]